MVESEVEMTASGIVWPCASVEATLSWSGSGTTSKTETEGAVGKVANRQVRGVAAGSSTMLERRGIKLETR